jgi:hypothetical protein
MAEKEQTGRPDGGSKAGKMTNVKQTAIFAV